jgi:hypothetical protein
MEMMEFNMESSDVTDDENSLRLWFRDARVI